MPVVNAMSKKRPFQRRTHSSPLLSLMEREAAEAERRKQEAAAEREAWHRRQQEDAAKRQARKEAAEEAARQAAKKTAKKAVQVVEIDEKHKSRLRNFTDEQREFAAQMIAARMAATTGLARYNLAVKATLSVFIPREQVVAIWHGVIDEAAAMFSEEDYANAQEWFRQRQDPDRYTSSHGYEVYIAPREDKS